MSKNSFSAVEKIALKRNSAKVQRPRHWRLTSLESTNSERTQVGLAKYGQTGYSVTNYLAASSSRLLGPSVRQRGAGSGAEPTLRLCSLP